MNNKKIFAIFFMLLVLISSLSYISASEEIELVGMKFNIPDGYQFLDSDTDVDDDGYACYVYTSNENDPNKDIIINVNLDSSASDDTVISSSIVKSDDEVDKTVNGVDGFYSEDRNTFTYQDGDYLVSIQAPEDLLEEIVTGKYDSTYEGSYSDDVVSDDIESEDTLSDNQSSFDILGNNILIIIVLIVIVVAGVGFFLYSKNKKNNMGPGNNMPQTANIQQNAANVTLPTNTVQQNANNVAAPTNTVQQATPTQDETTFTEKDNLGTFQNTLEKANAYWMGERFLSDYKPPFSLYVFKSAQDAKDALLELPFIHIARDSGNLICSKVLIYGFYKVEENNYEAIICGKDLTYDEFVQTENSFKKHGGTKRNNLEPDKNKKSTPKTTNTNKESSVKFREKFNKGKYTYECYDAKTSQDALDFLKTKPVNERLYYVCVYTPEGDYGRDIDGIYQM